MSTLSVVDSVFKWEDFRGSRLGLKWNRRDLPNLDRVIAHVPKKRVAVQAGGNLGIFPKRLAMVFETVYTFEPEPNLFVKLCHNAPESNIIKIQAALGDSHKGVRMSGKRRDGKPDTHEGITHVAGDGPIPTLRLDDLELTVVDLIQLDLEGWELYALRGARDTIRRCRPVLCVEINKSLGFVGIQKEVVRDLIVDVFGYVPIARLQSDDVYLPKEWGITQ